MRWKSEPLNNPLKFVDDSFGEIHHTLFEGDTDAPVLTFERFHVSVEHGEIPGFDGLTECYKTLVFRVVRIA